MLTGLFFKCADGTHFTAAIGYPDSADDEGIITILSDGVIYNATSNVKFADQQFSSRVPCITTFTTGKYIALARLLKLAGIFNHGGISRVEAVRDFPYHAANFDIHIRNEQKIRRSLQLITKHWGSVAVANCTYKHAFADK